MKILFIVILILILSGCATTSWHPERQHDCEVESQLRAQTYWGTGGTASAMAILDWWNCMSSD
jgi:uncharacterized protein YceK